MSEETKVPGNSKETDASSRTRTTSECSYTSDEGAASFTGKRQRTTSGQLFLASGLTSASPPKFVSLEEIMQAANGMRDMALVHQIVVDDDFKLRRAEPADDTHKTIKETMHKAFWDVLRRQLNEDPPNYEQAFVLLEEAKQSLFDLLLPQHTKIKQKISEVLDLDLIKQQAENETLNFQDYAQYIVSVMSKLCAPVRDDKIKELTQMSDIVNTFKGICETLDLMQLDMANFTIQIARPDIIASSVEFERQKFAKFLEVQPDGLEHTRKWLLKHLNTDDPVPKDVDYEKFIRSILKRALMQSCVDLIFWESEKPYPESFFLDEKRLRVLQQRTLSLVYIATVLLVSMTNIGPDLQSIATFKQSLKDHVTILLGSLETEREIILALPNVAEQVVTDLKEAQRKYSFQEISQVAEENLKQQIKNIEKADHKVKEIITQRIRDFLLDIIESSTAAPQKVPSGLTSLQKELTEIAGPFLRIVSHNSTVFCNYYYDIVTAALPKP